MAGNSKKVKDTPTTNGHWTNEKHVHFLNSMEASFVRTMFETNTCLPRLDRYLPDTSDSTQDLGRERRPTHSTSESNGTTTRMERKSRTSANNILSQDQVVPQFENQRGDKDDITDINSRSAA